MARKSKGFGELIQQQQSDKAQQKALDKLQKKVKKGSVGKKFSEIVMNPKGEVKMSEVLEDFVEPYLDFAKNHRHRESLFSIAVLAWNFSLIPEGDRPLMIDQIIQKDLERNNPLADQDTREIIDNMIARKQKYFAKYKRYIVDFQLQDAGKKFYLSVASTIANPITSEQ